MTASMKSVYHWVGRCVNAPYGTCIFSLLIFIEGFFIVPVSTMLAFYCLENRRKAFMYATLATCISGLGALAGYALGRVLWQITGTAVMSFFIAPHKFDLLVSQYEAYQAWAIFTMALTPVPFKALTLTAGFCKIPLVSFILYAIIARGIRFYSIATGIYFWGDKVHYYLNSYFYYVIALGIAVTFGTWWLLH